VLAARAAIARPGEISQLNRSNLFFCGIRRAAEINHLKLSLTGLLLFSGRHFAQSLEGSATGLEEMKRSICVDERHKDVITHPAGKGKPAQAIPKLVAGLLRAQPSR
jgi:hypothetical protein